MVYPSGVPMTRYPRSGKGRRWTILELKAIPVDWRGNSVSDGDGLVGEVRVASDLAVSVRFKYAFKREGKVSWAQCGTWPTVSLEGIRERRDQARSQVKEGVNPNDQRKADRLEAQASVEAVLADGQRRATERLTFRELFESWMADGVSRQDGNKELRRSFEKDLLSPLGGVEIRALEEKQLQEALRVVGRGRGRGRAAERLLADVVQMFAWAEKRKPWRALMVEGNPAALVDLRTVVPLSYSSTVRERTLSDEELRELVVLFARSESDYAAAPDKRRARRPVLRETQLAVWVCLSTGCRIGELLKARWENVHLAQAHWFVPKADTKTKVAWDVFLSPYALRQFEALKELTGESAWCFPARDPAEALDEKAVTKQIGDRQARFKKRKAPKGRRNDDSLVLAEGKFGAWTPHDMRRTASTVMQRLGIHPDMIDRCQNHVLPGSKVRRHYQHYEYEVEKRAAWGMLGAELERVFEGASKGKSAIAV